MFSGLIRSLFSYLIVTSTKCENKKEMKCLIYFGFYLLGKMFMAISLKWVWTGKNVWQFCI